MDKIIINWNIPNFDKVNKGGGLNTYTPKSKLHSLH